MSYGKKKRKNHERVRPALSFSLTEMFLSNTSLAIPLQSSTRAALCRSIFATRQARFKHQKKRAAAVFRSTVLPKHPFEKMNPILAVCVLLCGLIAAVSAGTTLCVCVRR
jgi:hypothetical protein